MNRPSFSGGYDSAPFQFSRPRGGSDRWLAAICGGAKLRVGARCLHVFGLHGHGRDMSLMGGRLFLGRRALVESAVAAIIADAGDRRTVHDPCFIHVANHGDVYVGHRTIVEKVTVVPTSAFVTVTEIAEAIVDSAIKSYLRTPVAIMENVPAVSPAPVSGRPEKTNFRSQYPSSGNPIVIIVSISPVARRPNVTIAGTYRLIVDRQLRRCNRNRDSHAHLGEGCRRHGQRSQNEQQ